MKRKKLDTFRDSVAHAIAQFALKHIGTKWYRDRLTEVIYTGLRAENRDRLGVEQVQEWLIEGENK